LFSSCGQSKTGSLMTGCVVCDTVVLLKFEF
jgi:hypothetical protein